jgi:four helix bundle protein
VSRGRRNCNVIDPRPSQNLPGGSRQPTVFLENQRGILCALQSRVVARRFQELITWQLARELRRSVRPLCAKALTVKDFDFNDQVRDAARSATANIAEGFPCSHIEFARFLEIAARSVREIEDRVEEAIDTKLIGVGDAEPSIRLIKRLTKAISRLRAHLLSTPDPPSYKPKPPDWKRRRP